MHAQGGFAFITYVRERDSVRFSIPWVISRQPLTFLNVMLTSICLHVEVGIFKV